jgi:hypothetical protein
MADYIYSLSVDFGGNVATSALVDEVNADVTITQDTNGITTLGDVVTISFPLALTAPEITALDAVVAAHPGVCKEGIVFGRTFSDVLTYGSTANNLQNAFLSNGANSAPSNQSAPIAEQAGEVIFVSISSNGDSSYWIDVVVDAFDGQPGTYSGGTVIASIHKAAGLLDYSEDISATPGLFTAGQRISTYLRKDGGGGSKPLVRLFLDYTN